MSLHTAAEYRMYLMLIQVSIKRHVYDSRAGLKLDGRILVAIP